MPTPASSARSSARQDSRRASQSRTSPIVVRRIAHLAAEGWTYADIARDCRVSRATAHKFGATARPKPDGRVHLNEHELASLRELARSAIRLPCPRCQSPVLAFAFMAVTRCTRCATPMAVPMPPRRA
jgi:hypothetical protein